jgi:hypothetical protein
MEVMAERLTCRICETRKPKRHCPGVGGEICPQCCGREREETIHCPLDCEYLIEARKHDKPSFDGQPFPHAEIRVDEEFVEDNRELFTVVSMSLIRAAHQTPGVVDNDLRDCLEACIRTYLTLDSGLIYESKPANLVGAAVQARLTESIAEFKKFAYEKTGVHSIKDGDLTKILVFLQRLELTSNNGRRYGRAFLWSLQQAFFSGQDSPADGFEADSAGPPAPSSSLIL